MANIDMDKMKAIESAMGQIEKQFGKGSIMKLGEHSSLNVDAISTGSLDLDIALGIGRFKLCCGGKRSFLCGDSFKS